MANSYANFYGINCEFYKCPNIEQKNLFIGHSGPKTASRMGTNSIKHFWRFTFSACKNIFLQGRGGGQVVSVLAFYSNDLFSNPADAHSFFCKISV